MQFKISGIVAALLVAQQAAAAITPQQILTLLNAADNVAKNATGLFNASTDADFVKGLEGTSRLEDAAKRVSDGAWALESDPPEEGFSAADQQSICAALKKDAKIQEALLDAVTKAHDTFVPGIHEHMVAVWVYGLKLADDHLRFSLKGLVPACDESMKKVYDRLNLKFSEVMFMYVQDDVYSWPGTIGMW